MAKVDRAEQPIATVSDGATLLQVISRAASDPACDIEKMERLMQMHERMQRQKAESEFNAAMTAAQMAMRPISADAENPQTRSKYATYAQLDRALRPIYGSNGFSISYNTGDGAPDGYVRVLAYASHSGGHTRTYQADMPNDGKGAKGNDVMTKTHAQGAAMSYGMRYLLKMIFNVCVGEDDRDGNGQSEEDATRNEWLEVISACATQGELTVRKQECIQAYGMVDKVPAKLRQAFVSRKQALAK
jgi:hypothetical protein